jgi:PAS domain S-box-containing protein
MKPYRILIVDDDPNILNSISTLLIDEDFVVSTVENGEKAVELLKNGNFDLVLTDLVMGKVDGIDVLKVAKEQNSDTRVIILTGFREMNSAIDSLRLKADDFLLKPCESDELLLRMSNCLNQLDLIRKNRKIELELKKSEERYRNLVECTHDLIWSMDLYGYYSFSNKAVIKFLGYEPEEIVNNKIFSKIHPDEMKQIIEMYKKSIKEKCGWKNVVIRWFHKDGSIRLLESTATPVFDSDDQLRGFNGIDRDVTMKKRMEDEMLNTKKLESIGILTKGIAHNFNNILAIILGNTELSLDIVPKWNPVYDNLQIMKNASWRASDLVKQLTTFSRYNDQKLENVNIGEIINESNGLLRSKIPGTIEIRYDIQTTDETILSDPVLLNQILMNLCLNSSDAMENTVGLIEISAKKVFIDNNAANDHIELKRGNYIQLVVKDSGTGIDPSIIDQIFDPFFTTKDIGNGFGMGLAVVHGIVKYHKGAIRVDSKPGKGAAFTIYFPGIQTVTKEKSDESDTLLMGNEKILFVDDEEAVVSTMKKALERLGYNVKTTTNPKDAMNMIRSKPDMFDLIISDMIMPQMTGVMLFEEVRKIRKDIPFIICTGHSELINEYKAKAMGISHYIMKPFSIKKFAESIRNVFTDNYKN